VATVMQAGTYQMANLWRGRPEGQTELEFYERDDVGTAYVTDLAAFQIKMGGHLTSQFKDIKDKRVLDFGSGIGTHALILASQGCSVDCVEVNQVMREFTEWRAQKRGLTVNFVDKPRPGYDVALCYHVLEHVPNPQEVADVIVNALNPGGRLFTESDFEDDGAHPMHHVDKTNRRGEKFWKGLDLIDMWWWEKSAVLAGSNGSKPSRAERRRLARAGA
ncbi:MAG TPA: class I SAM-dependent methyltransferase, partial [Dehalococcoidia bacterium]|nr:class I SAM-dependent methyltransferase [Dehalococcoidia bacterium]